MRLTLRNLLRFLDQAEMRSIERSRLEELVDESEKADAWIERIDRLRRDATMSAPALYSHDPGISTVAAYLASEMSEEQTIDFEQLMLSSDQLLAEVAGCHEIRESLHNENPPAISILLRQSIYDLDRNGNGPEAALGETTESVSGMAAAMEDLPFVDSQPGKSSQPGPSADEFPESGDAETVSLDKLTEQAQKKSRLITVGLLVILAAMLGLTYWLGWMAGHYPGSIEGVAERSTERSEPGDTTTPPVDDNPDKIPGASDASSDPGETTEPGTEPQPEDPVVTAQHPLPPPETPEPPAEDPDVLPPQPDIASVQIVVPPQPEPVQPPQQVAVLTEPDAILFLRETTTNTWQRVDVDIRLLELSEFLVLAGCTAQLDIGDGISLTVSGPARFSLGRRDKASGADVIAALYGEYKATSRQSDMDVLFDYRGQRYRVTMPVDGSSVTARFHNWFTPGSDPRSDPPAHLVTFVVDAGRASVHQGDESWSLAQFQALTRIDSSRVDWQRPPATGVPDRPAEIPRYLTRLENVVSRNTPEVLAEDRSLREQLAELKSSRRQELRYGALAWLASTGHYAYLVDFLNEESNRANWHSLIAAVRQSIAAQPEFAQVLYDDLDVAGVENQKKLYRLFCGTNPESLARGRDAELVDLLADENLAVRVLAIDNMRQITGGITYNYAPQAPRADRRRIIERQWKRELRKGEIRYSEPPALPEVSFAGTAGEEPAESPDQPAEPPGEESAAEKGPQEENASDGGAGHSP